MISGRILIVSDRREVVAELEPIIRAGDHMASVVPDGQEAMQMLDDGMVPDVVISDLGCDRSFDGIGYVQRFRQLNRTGAHLVVTEPGAPFTTNRVAAAQDRFAVLPRPFRPDDVRPHAGRRRQPRGRGLPHPARGGVALHGPAAARGGRGARRDGAGAGAHHRRPRPLHAGPRERVAEGCRKVALALNVMRTTRLLAQAARLHEIGKISIPVELLQKTDPLTPEELERIRSHPRVGADIVRGVPSCAAWPRSSSTT